MNKLNPSIAAAMMGAILGGWNAAANPAAAQVPVNYGQYYNNNLVKYHGQVGTQSSTRYLYDKYFYHSPGVSPYMNIFRPDTMSGTAYHAYVRPEQQRRERAQRAELSNLQQRKVQGNIGSAHLPYTDQGGYRVGTYGKSVPRTKAPSAYYNHMYGSIRR